MADHTPVRVALLNDHSLVVEGLAAMLRPFSDRVEVVDVSTQAPVNAACDIALFDTYGTLDPKVHWSDFVAEGWSPRIVALYTWDPATMPPILGEDAPPAIQVSKSLDGESLVEALELIHTTGSYEAGDGVWVGDQSTSRPWPGKTHGLSERESEIIALVVEGLSNEELATRLFLGINTVKTYIRTAYRKMGVTSRSTAVLWGIDHGFRRKRPSH